MTLLDYALFQKIRPSEYNNVAWTKKNKEILSPNLLRFIRRFNDVSIWVQNTILSGKSAKKRAALVDNFAKAAVAFRKLNNFNGVMQIVSAMEGAAVHRLQKTFERVRPKSRTKYAELLELMSSSGSYKFYREVRHTHIVGWGAASAQLRLRALLGLGRRSRQRLRPLCPTWACTSPIS